MMAGTANGLPTPGRIPPYRNPPASPPWPRGPWPANPPFALTIQTLVGDPRSAPQIYAYGIQPVAGRPWPGRPDFRNAQDLKDWHRERRINLWGLTVPATPASFPMTAADLDLNLAGMQFPILALIEGNHKPVLRALCDAGLWDPLAHDVRGVSYLRYALDFQAYAVSDYILEKGMEEGRMGMPMLVTWTGAPHTMSNITGVQGAGNALDLLLMAGRYDDFIQVWDEMNRRPPPPRNPLMYLLQESIDRLARYVDRERAEAFALAGCDLSTGVPIRQNDGTLWHVAVRFNQNADFLDFLAARRQGIDQLRGGDKTPLAIAYSQHKLEHFERLLSHGADPQCILPLLFAELPNPRDKYLEAVLPCIRVPTTPANTRVDGGSLLHSIVRAHHKAIINTRSNPNFTHDQKKNQRQRLNQHAKKLIRAVRAGNVNGPGPDKTTLDMDGKQALELAGDYRLRTLYPLLTPP